MYLASCMISVLVYIFLLAMICVLSWSCLLMDQYTVKISVLYTTVFGGSLTATYFGVTFKLLKKAMFYSIVSIWRIITTITGRNALTFITGEMLATRCNSRKVVQLSCHLFCVNLHTFYSEKQLSWHPFGVNLLIFLQ